MVKTCYHYRHKKEAAIPKGTYETVLYNNVPYKHGSMVTVGNGPVLKEIFMFSIFLK